jgi:lambda family phage tail tape measure protein
MSIERVQVVISETGGASVVKRLQDIGQGAVDAQGQVDLLSRAFGLLTAAFSVSKIVDMIDSYTNMQNRLKLVTTSTENLAAVTDQLFKISNDTRTSFDATATLYARMALATKDLGVGQKQLLGFVNGVNEAVVLSGVGAQEARNAIIQFTQGLAKGRLDGDELRSVLEQIPFVADVIAKHLGVARGALRDLGKQGKLTPTVIMEAFSAMDGELSAMFAKTLPTISQAFVVVQNRIERFFGELARDSSLNQAIAQGLAWIADNIDLITAGITSLLPLLAALLGRAALGGLISLLGAIAAMATSFGGALVLVVGALGGAIVAFGQLDKSMDDTLERMGLTVGVVDKFAATWIGAKAFIQAAWEDFPQWFGDLWQAAMDQALKAFANVADLIPHSLQRVGSSIADAMNKSGLNGEFFRNMFSDIAAQFKSGDDILNDVAKRTAERIFSPNSLDKAEGAYSSAYNMAIIRLAHPVGQLTDNLGKAADAAVKLNQKLIPKYTFNDAIKQLQDEIELLGIDASERDALTKAMQIQDKIKQSISDKDARRAFQLSTDQVDQIVNMELIKNRLKEQAQVLDDIRGPQGKVMSQMTALLTLYRDGTISLDEYNKKYLELAINLSSLDNTLQGGIMNGLLKLQQEYQNVGGTVSDTLVQGFHSAEDALVQFVSTGKIQFGSLVDSIVQDLIRMQIRAAITGPLSQALTSFASSYFGASVNGAGFSMAGVGATAATNGGAMTAGASFGAGTQLAFATGGDMTVGGSGGVDSQMVNFKATPGEKIYVRKAGERDPSDGGGTVVQVGVVIHNNGDSQVRTQQSKNGQGQPQIDVFIDQIKDSIASDVRKGQGSILPAMAAKLGASVKPSN